MKTNLSAYTELTNPYPGYISANQDTTTGEVTISLRTRGQWDKVSEITMSPRDFQDFIERACENFRDTRYNYGYDLTGKNNGGEL